MWKFSPKKTLVGLPWDLLLSPMSLSVPVVAGYWELYGYQQRFKGRLLVIYSSVPILTKEPGDNLPYLFCILQRPDKMLMGRVSLFLENQKTDLEALYIAEKKTG